jgi:hypothetical protein
MRKPTKFAIMALCMLLGLGGKALRYLSEGEPAPARAGAAVEIFLAAAGWQPGRKLPLTAAGTYEVQLYRKDGCPTPIAIVVLGPADEIQSMISLKLGADVAYLEAGKLSPRPSAPGVFRHMIVAGASLMTTHVLPIIAIAPAPGVEGAPCAPPPRAAWLKMNRL